MRAWFVSSLIRKHTCTNDQLLGTLVNLTVKKSNSLYIGLPDDSVSILACVFPYFPVVSGWRHAHFYLHVVCLQNKHCRTVQSDSQPSKVELKE